jgi:hypothetical protein
MVYWLTSLLVNGLPADSLLASDLPANSLPADQNLIQDILSLPANDLLVDKSTGLMIYRPIFNPNLHL